MEQYKPGDYVNVLVEKTTTAVLIGKIVIWNKRQEVRGKRQDDNGKKIESRR
jgi:hypothetical protein